MVRKLYINGRLIVVIRIVDCHYRDTINKRVIHIL